MPRTVRANAQAQRATQRIVRTAPEIIAVIEHNVKDQAAIDKLARSLNDEEMVGLLAYAEEQRDVKNAATKLYDAARLIIQARARMREVKVIEGDGVAAVFEGRTSKETDYYGLFLVLQKSTFWKALEKDQRRAVFNKCFKATGELTTILGADLVAQYTEEKRDDHATLKLKRTN